MLFRSLRDRYRLERDKRVRPDGNSQYIEPTGRFAHFLDDPYVPRVDRAPLTDEVTFAFIGGGFAGLVTGARVKQAGIDDVRIVEGGGDVGGAWYWNRYPGARCDTESMQYSFGFSDELQQSWSWSQHYAPQPEILRYARHVADRFDLRRDIRFETRVTGAAYDEKSRRWTVRTDTGKTVSARFCVMATGCLSAADRKSTRLNSSH